MAHYHGKVDDGRGYGGGKKFEMQFDDDVESDKSVIVPIEEDY